MIKIRQYKNSDAQTTWDLFYNTVRKVNICHYTYDQVQAWAPDVFKKKEWTQRMRRLNPFIAELNGVVVGYADLQSDGLIDHFFCHHQYQGLGIGAQLMQHILSEGHKNGITRYYSEVSITAKPFYERFAFTVISEQTVQVRGQTLTNFMMEKHISHSETPTN